MAPKFCMDCKHIYYAGVLPVYRGVQCAHKNNLGPVNLVNGGQSYKKSPEQLRAEDGECGPYGMWFRPKKGVVVLQQAEEAHSWDTSTKDDDPPKRKHWWQTLIGG